MYGHKVHSLFAQQIFNRIHIYISLFCVWRKFSIHFFIGQSECFIRSVHSFWNNIAFWPDFGSVLNKMQQQKKMETQWQRSALPYTEGSLKAGRTWSGEKWFKCIQTTIWDTFSWAQKIFFYFELSLRTCIHILLCPYVISGSFETHFYDS